MNKGRESLAGLMGVGKSTGYLELESRFIILTIGLSTTQAEYAVVLFKLVCGFTGAVEKSGDRQVGVGMVRGVGMTCN